MRTPQLSRSILPLFVTTTLILSACGDRAAVFSPTAPPAQAGSATVSEVVNVVLARLSELETFTQVANGFVLGVGGQVQTGDASSAKLELDGGTVIRLGGNTAFTLSVMDASDEGLLARLQLDAGKLYVTLLGGALEVETPVGVASVRGSYAVFEYQVGDPADPSDDVLVLDCLEGSCAARNEAVDERLGNLEQVTLSRGGRRVERLTLTGADVEAFLAISPESTAIVATLTAAPPPTETPPPSATPTASPTDTQAPEDTPTSTVSPTEPPTATPTASATATLTRVPRRPTATFTPSPTATSTLPPTDTPTASPVPAQPPPTDTPVPVPTNTPVPPVTTLTFPARTASFGSSVNFEAALFSSAGLRVANKTVNFFIGSAMIGSGTTDANGVARLSHTPSQGAGTYSTEARFDGDAAYGPSASGNTLTVTQSMYGSITNVASPTGSYGTTVILTGNINPTVSGKTLDFEVDGTPVGSATTDSTGKAELSYTVTQTASGSYTVKAKFVGDADIYGPIYGMGTLTVP